MYISWDHGRCFVSLLGARREEAIVFPVAGSWGRRERLLGSDEASPGIGSVSVQYYSIRYWIHTVPGIRYSVLRDSWKELCCRNGYGSISLWVMPAHLTARVTESK